jgi:hypothetical protein
MNMAVVVISTKIPREKRQMVADAAKRNGHKSICAFLKALVEKAVAE